MSEVLNSISRDRARTNLLKKYEQIALAWLVQRIPSWISSNLLTAIGFFGSVIVFVSFLLARYIDRNYLLLGVLGFLISWFGDSLDGRLAYYRNKPRKLYGFVLDITMDWISIIIIGCGYIVYAEGVWELMGYGFVLMYGWEMIIALMRYKITGEYSIDAGKLGPTEARIIISAIMIAEVFLPGSLVYSVVAISILLFVINVIDTRKLTIIADEIDKKNKSCTG
ncbi:MAG: CDP-alcohol phosphatidyltransferase [Bacteroidetes bacterium RBG_13_43_22]|nr:MAG: CDP-alcohol phosphatidyltransferase [Bacteroidetes bacterium RBG_13_43_22]